MSPPKGPIIRAPAPAFDFRPPREALGRDARLPGQVPIGDYEAGVVPVNALQFQAENFIGKTKSRWQAIDVHVAAPNVFTNPTDFSSVAIYSNTRGVRTLAATGRVCVQQNGTTRWVAAARGQCDFWEISFTQGMHAAAAAKGDADQQFLVSWCASNEATEIPALLGALPIMGTVGGGWSGNNLIGSHLISVVNTLDAHGIQHPPAQLVGVNAVNRTNAPRYLVCGAPGILPIVSGDAVWGFPVLGASVRDVASQNEWLTNGFACDGRYGAIEAVLATDPLPVLGVYPAAADNDVMYQVWWR